MLFIIRDTLLLPLTLLAFTIVSSIIDEFFILYKEYLSKPREFSKNSFILSKTGNCTPVFSIEKVGVKLSLLIKKDPSPSINPSNQYLVIIILELSGLSKLIRLVFILFFSSIIFFFIAPLVILVSLSKLLFLLI
jgi:hypothetical protein